MLLLMLASRPPTAMGTDFLGGGVLCDVTGPNVRRTGVSGAGRGKGAAVFPPEGDARPPNAR